MTDEDRRFAISDQVPPWVYSRLITVLGKDAVVAYQDEFDSNAQRGVYVMGARPFAGCVIVFTSEVVAVVRVGEPDAGSPTPVSFTVTRRADLVSLTLVDDDSAADDGAQPWAGAWEGQWPRGTRLLLRYRDDRELLLPQDTTTSAQRVAFGALVPTLLRDLAAV